MLTKIGEVIEASTGEFVAECYELHTPPPLGSLVRTTDGQVEIYGVVRNASTESIDPGRRPLARGREESEEENIYRQHPQLSRLLRTTFDTLVIGHGQGDELHHYLPPRPPRVHSFVYVCEGDEVRRFTRSLDFLAILLSARAGSVDEVVSACLRQAAGAHDDERAFLVKAGKELAILLGGELNRLNAILRRIKQ
ncbi:MAG: hypothetical protein E3J42_05405 [Dehalococcoidia bacterium]|nr:MAG: hypothetical protein E3J42_05405 [Dehalococcoidia bacterium]